MNMDYNAIHSDQAAGLQDLRGGKVLAVGCNTGRDCGYFAKHAPKTIHGVDILPNVGANCSLDMTAYVQADATRLPFRNGVYDLVYCFATLEHVRHPEESLKEMVRVCAPGGHVYCHSAPLWFSRTGHHMPIFFKHPWIHLFFDKHTIVAFANENSISHETTPIDALAEYMYSDLHFNKIPGPDYVSFCDKMTGIDIISNNLTQDSIPESQLPTFEKLLSLGYSKTNLLGSAHTFIARKK